MLAIQMYDVPASLIVPDLRQITFVLHHLIVLCLAWVALRYRAFYYYGAYFMAVIELSTPLLSVVDSMRDFPKLGDAYPMANEVCRVAFGIVFLAVRVVGWIPVSIHFWRDCLGLFEDAAKPGAPRRNIRVAAAASPRPIHGVAAMHPRRRRDCIERSPRRSGSTRLATSPKSARPRSRMSAVCVTHPVQSARHARFAPSHSTRNALAALPASTVAPLLPPRPTTSKPARRGGRGAAFARATTTKSSAARARRIALRRAEPCAAGAARKLRTGLACQSLPPVRLTSHAGAEPPGDWRAD